MGVVAEAVVRDGHARQCTAMSSQTGKRCRAFAIRGGSVCFKHGGGSPQVKAKAVQRLEVERVTAEVGRVVGRRPQVRTLEDVLDALVDLAGEAVEWKETLGEKVDALTSLRYVAPGAGTEQLRAEVALYERAMDRAAKFVDLVGKFDFESIRVRLSAGQGALLANVIREILDDLDLSPEQRALVPVVVPRVLRRAGTGELP